MDTKDLIFWYTGLGVWAVIAIAIAGAVIVSAILCVVRTWHRINTSFATWYLCKRLKENNERSLQEIRDAGNSMLRDGNLPFKRETLLAVMERIGQRMLKAQAGKDGG